MNTVPDMAVGEQSPKFRWTVTFSVAPVWVQDGFELTEEVAKEMIAKALPYAYHDEYTVRIDKAPPPAVLKAARR